MSSFQWKWPLSFPSTWEFLAINNLKMPKSTYFVKTRLCLQKSCSSEVSIGEVFLNLQRNQLMCGEKCTLDQRIVYIFSRIPVKLNCCIQKEMLYLGYFYFTHGDNQGHFIIISSLVTHHSIAWMMQYKCVSNSTNSDTGSISVWNYW